MPSMNSVNIIGNLTRDPELKYTPNGAAVCKLGLAMNRRYRKSGSDDWSEETCFVDVTVWGKHGEAVAEYQKKGNQLGIVGRLTLSQWEQDGKKRSKLEVTAESVVFLSKEAPF